MLSCIKLNKTNFTASIETTHISQCSGVVFTGSLLVALKTVVLWAMRGG